MILAALVLGMATLHFANTLPSARLSATGREMTAMIRQLKIAAQNKGEDQVLTINLDSKEYGPEGGSMKSFPSEMIVTIQDPDEGEIVHGKYEILFHATGGIDGGTVLLQYRTKKISLQIDPVVGAVVS
jgi:hypothetical protein